MNPAAAAEAFTHLLIGLVLVAAVGGVILHFSREPEQ